MSDDLGLDFASATEVSEAQQAFGLASTKLAIGFSFGGGKGFPIPGLSVNREDPAPSVGSKPSSPGFTP